MVDLSDPAEADNAYRISFAWRELRRGGAAAVFRDYLFGVGDDALEPREMDTLDVLMTCSSWRMSELAEALRVDPSTATRAVQRLANAGLVERRTCGDDGRVVRVKASKDGRRRHRTVAKRRAAAMSRLLGAFDSDERRQLADLLSRFADELDVFTTELVAEAAAAEADQRTRAAQNGTDGHSGGSGDTANR